MGRGDDERDGLGPSLGETVKQAEVGTCSVEYAKRPMDNERRQKNAGRANTHDDAERARG